LCTQIICALKLTFVGVPIMAFDPLISPCPFARLHSPSLDNCWHWYKKLQCFHERGGSSFCMFAWINLQLISESCVANPIYLQPFVF
jgi:hypothetical protein